MTYKIFDSINKEGYIPLGVLVVITCISFALSWGLGVTSLILTASCAYFFRDPVRVVPIHENIILSPADGTIYNIDHNYNDQIRISIFLSVLNVHINRIPISGTVTKLNYHPGKFIRASSHKESEDNEKQEIVIQTGSGVEVQFAQIAGFIARRIICELKEGETVIAGKRFGMIKFGSRVDIILPANTKLAVAEGQTVVGGETILADLSGENKVYEHRTE